MEKRPPLINLIRLILLIGTLGFAFMIIFGIAMYYYYSRDLPKLDTLKDYTPPVVSEVFDDQGNKIGEFWSEKRIVIPPDELPKGVVQAVVASEDDRFFEHKGIDYQGIVRAFFENLKAGHVVQGGSTITQQVTKAFLLTREKTLARKIKEAILATRIEKNLNKDEILYLYLNQIFLGNRAYGIEAAAQNYFHKTARELNIAEAALIAGLAKAPSTYSPITNPELAKSRQEYVIDRMYEVGYITKDQAKKAKEYPLQIYRAETDKEFNCRYASWFTEYIRRYIQETYGEQVPYTHGLKIYTTLDQSMQKAADRAVARGLAELDKRQGYAGPIRQLDQHNIGQFAKNNHLNILNEKLQSGNYFNRPSEDEMLRIPTPIEDDKKYEAVITNADSKKQNLEILVGTTKGIIRVHDYAWARKRNTNLAGYDGTYYIRDPKGTFNKGDVILVKKKIPADSDFKSNGYEAGKNYFSLEQKIEVEGALFSYELQSGYVRAMVGGKDFKESEYNRAIQSHRQPGSAFKPLLYASALDKGYTTNTIIEDSPIYYEYLPGRFWSPQNYGGGYRGPTPFRNALVFSRNVVSVRILMDVGTHYVTAYARKLGITTPIKKYYSMALGSNDMKLYELSRAYGTFPNGGILPEFVFIKRMVDRFDRVVEEHQPREIVPFTKQLEENLKLSGKEKDEDGFNQPLLENGEKWIKEEDLNLSEIEKKILYGKYIPEGYTISPRTAYTMVQLMQDIVQHGTGYRVKSLNRPAGGKTGTTNDETDTWFVGYIPNLFAGVWVGFDELKKIGGRETGGKTAAPIFLYYMEEVTMDKPVAEFVIPKEIDLAAFDAPKEFSGVDAEEGGVGDAAGGGADFFIYDF